MIEDEVNKQYRRYMEAWKDYLESPEVSDLLCPHGKALSLTDPEYDEAMFTVLFNPSKKLVNSDAYKAYADAEKKYKASLG